MTEMINTIKLLSVMLHPGHFPLPFVIPLGTTILTSLGSLLDKTFSMCGKLFVCSDNISRGR